MIKRFIIAFVLVVLVVGGLVGFNLFRDQAIEQFFANMPRPTVDGLDGDGRAGDLDARHRQPSAR